MKCYKTFYLFLTHTNYFYYMTEILTGLNETLQNFSIFKKQLFACALEKFHSFVYIFQQDYLYLILSYSSNVREMKKNISTYMVSIRISDRKISFRSC